MTATYSIKANGNVDVKNCCTYLGNSTNRCDIGEAKISHPDKQPLPGQLTVRFNERKFKVNKVRVNCASEQQKIFTQ